ncbi:MAG: hypothetical protein WB586_09595 [Chthoniobacterales bacterium]
MTHIKNVAHEALGAHQRGSRCCLQCERFDFSRSNNVFPYALSSLAAELDVSYWSGDEFHPLLKLEPGVYFTRDYIIARFRAGPDFYSKGSAYLKLDLSIDLY